MNMVLNNSGPDDGFLIWECEQCGEKWNTPVSDDPDYDRTKDKTNWPVICKNCCKNHQKNNKEI